MKKAVLLFCLVVFTYLAQGEDNPYAPQADGTPLPAPTKEIANRWAPEVKKFIEGLEVLFNQHARSSLTVAEIQQTLGVKLQREKGYVGTFPDVQYIIEGGQLQRGMSYPWSSTYIISKPDKNGQRSHHFDFPIDTKRFCLSPYELAIYMGHYYLPQMPAHGFRPPDRIWPPAYEWGMFKRNSIATAQFNPNGGPPDYQIKTASFSIITSNDCVVNIRAITNTTKDFQP